jgi:hypothetical protein
VKVRWVVLVLVAVAVAVIGGGYLWLRYGGQVVAEGRVKVRVSYAGYGDPRLEAAYVNGDLTNPKISVPSFVYFDRRQAPSNVAEGDLLDCAYVQRAEPITNRSREPVITDCRQVTG